MSGPQNLPPAGWQILRRKGPTPVTIGGMVIRAAASLLLALVLTPLAHAQDGASLVLDRKPDARPRNVVIVLTDDHRYDLLGVMGHPFVETPHMDSLARSGALFRNAFVTTALCSPSRASILTGLYAHRHRVVDNNNPIPPGTTFFPQYLQRAGYATAFIGKWHMGGDSARDGSHNDGPQPGFDHWISFPGQGTYLPSPSGLNINGTRVPQKGYITDELTDYALEWLNRRDPSKPFFLLLSHKGVHSDFLPAERHRGRYAGKTAPKPPTLAPAAPDANRPTWVANQRNSWHGVEFPYHSDLDVDAYYRAYAETLLSVDDSLGRVLGWLKERKLDDDTLVIYLGDNGFMFGEHGLIDKRTAYEASMRIPLLMQAPGLIEPGTKIDGVAANIDLASTVLDAAGLVPPAGLDGSSLLPLATGAVTKVRDALLYEYYWERNFPQTPTIHALRTDRYKYVHYHGIWDTDELFDLQADPHESKNLIADPAHQATLRALNTQLFALLEQTEGMYIPLYPDRGFTANKRREGGSRAADFPKGFYVKPQPPPGAPPAPKR
jgi:N-acetylglucosamine-6-sulfatase